MTANNATPTPLIRVSGRRVNFESIAVGTSLPIIYFLTTSILAPLRKLTTEIRSKDINK